MSVLIKYRVLLWLLLAVGWGHVHAQVVVTGRVTDRETGGPLAGASLQVVGTALGAITDADGRYRLTITGSRATVQVQYLGYQPQVLRMFPERQTVYDIALEPQAVSLPTTTITSDKLQRVYPHRQTMVIDYEFLKEDVLVIIYDANRRRNVLQLLSADFVVLAEHDNPAEPPRALVQDCLGASHCITEHFSGQIDWLGGTRITVRYDSLVRFRQVLEPCLAYVDSTYYFASMRGDYAKQFQFVHLADRQLQPFYDCVDRKAMATVRDEVVMGGRTSLTTQVTIEDASGSRQQMRAGFQSDLNRRYLKEVLCPPIYVPIKVVQGQAHVFDHPNGRIVAFDLQGHITDAVSISYPALDDWKKEVLVNAEESEAFTLTEKNGYVTVHRIDLDTGALDEAWELPFPFVQKIKIRGGYIYFSYRDRLEDNVKRLYRLQM
jgi:CarboxypepD_reg-like domain